MTGVAIHHCHQVSHTDALKIGRESLGQAPEAMWNSGCGVGVGTTCGTSEFNFWTLSTHEHGPTVAGILADVGKALVEVPNQNRPTSSDRDQ